MIGSANGVCISITGLGCRVPERVVTNDELSTLMDTSDEWIRERTGIRERRIAEPEEALSDLCLPACRDALEGAGLTADQIDLIIVATVTPDMNGREVFKFATRVLVSSAEAVLAECGRTIDDVDVYVPHQANVRIIEHARQKLGIPEEKTVIDVDRYGNTSSGSIPLALADATADGRLRPGQLVLMTGMGAGLTWGSGLIEWTAGGDG